MKFSRIAVSVSVAWLASVAAVQAQSWNTGTRQAFGRSTADTALGGQPVISPVEILLAQRVESVDWEDTTFEEVLDWLRDQADGKVNVLPRWPALNAADVDADKTVTLTLNNTTVQAVMTEVLDTFSAESGSTVRFRGEGNMLRISSLSDFDRKLQLRIYDVTDILFRLPDFSQSAPQVDLQRRSGGGGGGGGGGEPVFANAGGQSEEELSEDGDQDPEEILQDLVDLIENAVEPLTWDTNGGQGRIRGYAKRSIVVYNTVGVHEQIAGYFSRSK